MVSSKSVLLVADPLLRVLVMLKAITDYESAQGRLAAAQRNVTACAPSKS